MAFLLPGNSASISLQRTEGERPILLIGGREPSSNGAIRQAISKDDIVLENCTLVRISRNGVTLSESSPDDLRALLGRETSTVLEFDLLNQFDSVANPINQSYRINVSIPEKAELDAADRDFVRLLASASVHLSDVSVFLRQRSTQGVAWDYADALASYVRGVLVKDGRGGSTLPFGEAERLYGRALETLQDFRRPLATVICSLVRLAYNDFSLAGETTGFGRLDQYHTVMAPTLGHGLSVAGSGHADQERRFGETVPICPVDNALDRIFCLSEQVRDQQVSLIAYRRVLALPNLTKRDRAKVYALYGLAALQSNASFEAREALRRIRNEYPFEAWASRELDRLDG